MTKPFRSQSQAWGGSAEPGASLNPCLSDKDLGESPRSRSAGPVLHIHGQKFSSYLSGLQEDTGWHRGQKPLSLEVSKTVILFTKGIIDGQKAWFRNMSLDGDMFYQVSDPVTHRL